MTVPMTNCQTSVLQQIVNPTTSSLPKINLTDIKKPRKKKLTPPRLWTPKEDVALKKAVSEYGERNWKAIAQFVPERTHTQCFQRWHKVLSPGLRKGRWTDEEDMLLKNLALAQVNGCKLRRIPPKISWGVLCRNIKGRTAKQCRERWLNNVNPDINRTPWTREEDELIKRVSKIHPHRWAYIARQLNNRTENAVKMRCNSLKKLEKTFKDSSKAIIEEISKGTKRKQSIMSENSSRFSDVGPNKRPHTTPLYTNTSNTLLSRYLLQNQLQSQILQTMNSLCLPLSGMSNLGGFQASFPFLMTAIPDTSFNAKVSSQELATFLAATQQLI